MPMANFQGGFDHCVKQPSRMGSVGIWCKILQSIQFLALFFIQKVLFFRLSSQTSLWIASFIVLIGFEGGNHLNPLNPPWLRAYNLLQNHKLFLTTFGTIAICHVCSTKQGAGSIIQVSWTFHLSNYKNNRR